VKPVDAKIFQSGNSAAVRLPKAVLEAMGARVGDEVALDVDAQHRLVVSKTEGNYERTRRLARRMRARYARTLDLFGR